MGGAIDGGRAVTRLEQGIEEGAHLGAQLYASVGGDTVVDVAIGEQRPSVAMTTTTANHLLCAAKPVTAVALARFAAAGELDVDDRVGRYIGRLGPDDPRTIRQLLTHTAALADDAAYRHLGAPWSVVVERVGGSAARHPPPARPAVTYSTVAAWYLLGEILRQVGGRPFTDVVATAVLEPFGMAHTYFTSAAAVEAATAAGAPPSPTYGPGPGGGLEPLQAIEVLDLAHECVPGVGARGPAADIGRLYEGVRRAARGEVDGLPPAVVESFTSVQRSGLHDTRYNTSTSWGLGFIVDRRLLTGNAARGTVVGHDALGSSVGFVDVARELVVAIVPNGIVAPALAQRRLRLAIRALYADLAL